MARSQGIDKAGSPWLRVQMVQLEWRWLRHQPQSALSKWFRDRTGTSGGRVRMVFVIALARKLLVRPAVGGCRSPYAGPAQA